MTVEEMIEALKALPREARSKPIKFLFAVGDAGIEIVRVDYDLTTISLHP